MAVAAKFFTTLLRVLQALGAVYAVGIISYFIVRVHNAGGSPSNEIYAIEAISGAGFLYACFVLLLTLCLLQRSGYQFFTMFVDFLFIGGFMAVAILLRGSTKQSCSGLGTGAAGATGWLENADSNTIRNCKLVKGVFGVGVAEAIMFLLTLFIAYMAHRQTKADRAFGPSPNNNYTSGWRRSKKRKDNPGAINNHNTVSKPQNAKDTAAAAAAGVGGAAALHSETGRRHSEETAFTSTTNEKVGNNNNVTAGREYHRPPVGPSLAAPTGFHTPGRTPSPAYNYGAPGVAAPADQYRAYPGMVPGAPGAAGVAEMPSAQQYASYPPRGGYIDPSSENKMSPPPSTVGGYSELDSGNNVNNNNPNYYQASELDSSTVPPGSALRSSTMTSEPVSAVEMPADRGYGTNWQSGGGNERYEIGGGEVSHAGHTGNVVDTLPEAPIRETPADAQRREMHF